MEPILEPGMYRRAPKAIERFSPRIAFSVEPGFMPMVRASSIPCRRH